MPKKHARHTDNDLIEQMGKAPSQQGSAGGNLAKSVGTRAEERAATGDAGVERVTGSDHPATDALKGRKSTSRMKGGG